MPDQRPKPTVATELEPMIESAREACIDQIQRQYALGRLTQEDLDDRVGLALQAKTLGALSTLTSDLAPAPPAAPVAQRPPARPGRTRRAVIAAAGAAAVLVAGLGIVGIATNSAPSQAAPYFFCEATGSEDPDQVCPAKSAAQIRLESYADQIENARYEIEEYGPSKDLLMRAEKAARLAALARQRARAEAVIEAAGGKPDTAAIDKLVLELEEAVRDSAEALAEAIANQPR